MKQDGTTNQLDNYGIKLKLQAALMTSKQPDIFTAEDLQRQLITKIRVVITLSLTYQSVTLSTVALLTKCINNSPCHSQPQHDE